MQNVPSQTLYAEMIVTAGTHVAKVLAVRLKPSLAEGLADRSLTPASPELFGTDGNGRMAEKMQSILPPKVFFRPEVTVSYRVTNRLGSIFDPDQQQANSPARKAAEALFEKRDSDH